MRLPLTACASATGIRASRPGSARIIGYRIYRNGELLGQPRGLSGSATNLAPATTYGFAVAAIDAAGYLSEPIGPAAVQTSMPTPTEWVARVRQADCP